MGTSQILALILNVFVIAKYEYVRSYANTENSVRGGGWG